MAMCCSADTVTYNQRTDTITASGHVSLSQPTGEIVFADYLELRKAMGDGFAENVRMLLTDRSRLAANTARLTNNNRTELRRAVYSPCDLCSNDPSAPPAWQFVARQIDDDKEFKLIEMRDATMEIDGWPILYTPYLSMPDPIGQTRQRFSDPVVRAAPARSAPILRSPYFLVLGPDKDITLCAAHHEQGGAGLRNRIPPTIRQRLDRCARQHQLQQPDTAQMNGGQLRGNINSTSDFRRQRGLAHRVSTCSASPIRAICCNSATATRR